MSDKLLPEAFEAHRAEPLKYRALLHRDSRGLQNRCRVWVFVRLAVNQPPMVLIEFVGHRLKDVRKFGYTPGRKINVFVNTSKRFTGIYPVLQRHHETV